MAVAIRGTTPISSIVTTASVSVTLTGARQPNTDDVLLIIHCNDFYTTSTMPTPTVDGSTSGVTAVTGGTADAGTDQAHAKAFTKVVASTGDLTVAVTETGSADEEKALVVYVLSGVDTAAPVDIAGNATNTGTTTHICPSVDPTSADAYLICHTNTGGGAAAASYTHPSGMTETLDTVTGGMSIGGASLQLSVDTATGTKTFVPNTSITSSANLSIAIKTGGAAAAADSSGYQQFKVPGLIGRDGRIYFTRPQPDNNGAAVSATSAPAGLADGTGSALQPSVALGVAPGAPAATGSAPQPSVSLGAAPGAAAGTGTAPQPTAAIGANAGLASGAGSALQPTVATSGSTNAPAGLASGSGTAQQPAVALGAQAGLAAATGSALPAATRVGPVAGIASGTGTALQPVVAVTVNAGIASGTGSALQATVSISGSVNAPAGLASGTGTAFAPTVTITVRPPAASGTGSALAATITTGKIALAGLAAATGTAFAPTIHITVRPPAAAGLGSALQPTTTAEVVAQLRVLPLYSSRIFGAAGYHANENQIVFLPNRLATGAPLVVVCHGTAAEASWYYESEDRWRPLEALANTGLVLVAGDLGEPSKPDGWGNDRSVAAIDEVITWAASEYGCATDRISFLGDSAGGATALNWVRQNPITIGGVALRAGVADVDAVYTTNAFLATLIDAAYDGSWAAAKVTHDPALNTPQFVPLADRIRCYYTSGDDLIPPASTLAFCAAVGCAAVPIGDMVHSDAIHPAIPAGDLADWLWDLHLTP